MRGEIDNFELDDRIARIPRHDRAIRKFCFTLWFTYDDLKSHRIHMSAAGWDMLRRMLAFLRSDLEHEDPEGNLLTRFVRKALSAVYLLILGAVLYWLWGRWWTLTAAWWFVGAIVYGLIALNSRLSGASENNTAQMYPFRDQQQWEANQHLLQGLELPHYDPAQNGPSDLGRGPLTRAVMFANGIVVFTIFQPIFAALIFFER
jgi:hypothetical protein